MTTARHPSKLDRNWTFLEIELAKAIYHRESWSPGAFKRKRPFNHGYPSRQMTRALLDARAALERLQGLGALRSFYPILAEAA